MKSLKISMLALGLFLLPGKETAACSRAVYLGQDSLVVTGRSMDWKEDIRTNLYLLPRGEKRVSFDRGKRIEWTSKYGSIAAGGYDLGTCDGMNEKGLVANLLYLTESVYTRPNDNRAVMGVSIWTQYVLDNFATVEEAVHELKKDKFRIDAPELPNGAATTMHLVLSDATGNSAVLEYLDGEPVVHEGREYQVVTNSPSYDGQLAVNAYWQEVGGLNMLPGTNRSSDRFARASFYIRALPQTADPRTGVAGVFSVIRNVSVPLGISTPDKPNISTTRWRSVADQKNKIYYFETTLSPGVFWIDLNRVDFSPESGTRKLTLVNGETYWGEANDDFKPSAPFRFAFSL